MASVTEGCSIRRRVETDNAINIFVSDKTTVLGISCTTKEHGNKLHPLFENAVSWHDIISPLYESFFILRKSLFIV